MEQLQALKEGRIDVGSAPEKRRPRDSPHRAARGGADRRPARRPPPGRARRALEAGGPGAGALLVYPKAPRPSFADQVLATFMERNLVPQQVQEVRELQIAIGLVGAGQGIAIVPQSLQGMIRTDVVYRPLDDLRAVSPIIFSTRRLDRSPELVNMLEVIYEIYDACKLPHVKEIL